MTMRRKPTTTDRRPLASPNPEVVYRKDKQVTTPRTQGEADTQLVKAIETAAKAGRPIAPDSPLGRAATAALARRQASKPSSFAPSFAKEIDQTIQTMEDVRRLGVESARQLARDYPQRPIPDSPAGAINRASLSGAGAIDLSGGASVISDFEGSFLAAERARELLSDPNTAEAMEKATAEAARHGRQPSARDFSRALAEVRAERGPQPVRPREPVTQLFADSSTAAKARSSSASLSPVPDRFGAGGAR